MRRPCLKAEPGLCPDAQGEGEGWGDQQDDPGDDQYDDHDCDEDEGRASKIIRDDRDLPRLKN